MIATCNLLLNHPEGTWKEIQLPSTKKPIKQSDSKVVTFRIGLLGNRRLPGMDFGWTSGSEGPAQGLMNRTNAELLFASISPNPRLKNNLAVMYKFWTAEI